MPSVCLTSGLSVCFSLGIIASQNSLKRPMKRYMGVIYLFIHFYWYYTVVYPLPHLALCQRIIAFFCGLTHKVTLTFCFPQLILNHTVDDLKQ